MSSINKKVAKRYYRTTEIDKTEAQYRLLLGERSNGKSYAVKEKVLKIAYKTHEEFIYMRRYMTDCRPTDVISYFADMPIESITQGVYSGVDVYRSEIFFCNYDDDYKVVRGKKIGRCVDLNRHEHFKSQAFPNVTNVIFEEFITNNGYLTDEPNILQNFISTIARDRNITVWLIGNKISRVCPYYTEWSLDRIPKQEIGTIDTYLFKRYDRVFNEEVVTKIAVENCENAGSTSKMFFGKVADAITGGQWEVKEYPHMPREYRDEDEQVEVDYVMLYDLLFSDMGFHFVLQLYINPYSGGQFVFVYPYTKNRRIRRHITSEFSVDPLTSNTFSDKITAEIKMKELIKQNKICFSDNLTGSDFEQVLLNRKGVL